MRSPLIVIARMLAFLSALLLIHWADEFVPSIFILIAAVAGIMLLSMTIMVLAELTLYASRQE